MSSAKVRARVRRLPVGGAVVVGALIVSLLGCGGRGDDGATGPTAGDRSPVGGASSTSGRDRVALPADAWRPRRGEAWHVQYSGALIVPPDVGVVNVDMADTDAEVIAGLHDRGVKVVCYISAGSWEPYRSDADAFPEAIVGEVYEGFEDERWLDIRSPSLRPPLLARIDAAVAKGCDAIDPDNVNGFENDTGFDLTATDQLAFNRWLFGAVHQAGLAVGLKNDLSQVDELIDEVDFAVNEECIEQDGCAPLAAFVEADKPVWSVEYTGDPAEVCAEAARLGLTTVIKDLDLGPGGTRCSTG